MTTRRPSYDGLGWWLAGGALAGAALLVVIVLAYSAGRNSAPSSAGAAPPAATAPAASAPSATPAPTAAAGQTLFAQTCGGCHMQAGTASGGIGPKLQGLGLPRAAIVAQIQNGGGPMPGGLVTGPELESVVAYVLSIQH